MRLEQVIFCKAGKFELSMQSLSGEVHSVMTDHKQELQELVTEAAERLSHRVDFHHEIDYPTNR
jgi:hypothetical protein